MVEQKKAISTDSLMVETRTFPPSKEVVKRAYIDAKKYQEMYDRSIKDPDGFWLEQAKTLDWFKKPTVARKYTWDTKTAHDQAHLVRGRRTQRLATTASTATWDAKRQDKIAILWQGEPEDDVRKITYEELHAEVCKFANVLKSLGVKKGDRVCIYLPMIPELPIAMLACARIGAIHSIVFGGFSADALATASTTPTCKMLITVERLAARRQAHPAEGHRRRGRSRRRPSIEKVVVVKRNDEPCNMQAGRDLWYHDVMAKASADCEPEPMNAEDPLFILYTSGSTGKPKGVVHTTGRLPAAHGADPQVHLRHPRRRHLLVHGRHRLGHRPQLHRLRPAGQRRHERSCSRACRPIPDAGRFWQIVRQVQGHGVLHRADRDPRADPPGRRVAGRSTT